MKTLFASFFLFVINALTAQTVSPGDKTIENKWIKNEKTQSRWLLVKDTLSYEIATILNDVQVSGKELKIITEIQVKGATTKWYDTTVVSLPTLKPIRHTSTNVERDIIINYNEKVTGQYNDKVTRNVAELDETTEKPYFGSSYYPYIIRLLPLKDGYTAELPIYDYHPKLKGEMKVSITDVKSGKFKTKNGMVDLWEVTTVSNLAGEKNIVKYYIGKKDRKLWRQDIDALYQKMLIRLIE